MLFPGILNADSTFTGWEAQLYGGEYYEDKRIGAYGAASASFLDNFSWTGELLHERYHDSNSDYTFSGIGGHLLWEAGEIARLGFVGSHSHEEYGYDSGFENPNSEYVTNTLGLEAEVSSDPIALAVQVGEVDSEYYSDDHPYFAMDLYYWGNEYSWYARGATRKTKHYEEYTAEVYRTFYAGRLPLNLYAGATRNDLSTKQEIRTFHTRYDSFYTGCYIEFFNTTSSSWNLWVEAARQDSDTVLSLELNISFGPGADTPYISAFGFTP